MKLKNIGDDAGKIWQIIDQKGNVKVSDLETISDMEPSQFYIALGWLARENKLHFFDYDGEEALCLIY